MKKALLFLFSFSLSIIVSAQVTWDGGGDGSTWEDPLNWSSDALPSNSDKVFISNASVSINSVDTIAELKLELGQFMISNGATLRVLTAPLSSGFTDAFKLVNGALVNNGTLFIRSSGATNGLVLNNSLCQNKNGAIIDVFSAKDTSVVIDPTSKFNNFNNSTLKMNGANDAALVNFKTFQNQGSVVITNAFNGIVNKDSILNQGSITMYGITGSHGVKNEYFFQNNGTIAVYDSDEKGLVNDHIFVNGSAGVIEIDTSNVGLLNTSNFKNDGEIYLTMTQTALLNENALEEFINNGLIDIFLTSLGIKNEGVTDSSYFTSGPGAEIFLNTTEFAVGPIGILNTGKASFTTDGEISLKRTEPYTVHNIGGVFNNKATMVLDSAYKEAIYVQSGVFNNLSGGIIHIPYSFAPQYGMVRNSSAFNNFGELSINYPDLNSIQKPMIYNSSNYLNTGSILLKGFNKGNGIENNGTLTNDGTVSMESVAAFGLKNLGTFSNDDNGIFTIDTVQGFAGLNAIFSNHTFNNSGKIHISNSSNVAINFDNSLADAINSGEIKIDTTAETAISLQGAGKKLINQAGGRIIIDSTGSSFDAFGINLLAGTIFINQGFFQTSRTKSSGINITSASITNEDSLIVKSAYSYDALYLDNSTFENKLGAYLGLEGTGANALRLLNVPVASSFTNAGEIEVIDANAIGIKVLGTFNSLANSMVRFTNNTRNTSSLFEASAINYNGNMQSSNSKKCVNFTGASFIAGFLDLRGCSESSIFMSTGDNQHAGRILSGAISLIGNNKGILEFYSPSLLSISGTNVMINTGIIIDHNDALRNVRFNDGGALGFPIWNQGLFVSPFYGTLSSGVKETLNLNFTDSGTLPITTDWYTDRAKTQVAGTWEQNLHEFTPNALANAADSLYFEANLSGVSPIVLSIPHLKPVACPYPKITKIFRANSNYIWNKHTTWRGNRAPDLCQEVLISGNEATTVESGFKAKVNFINYTPNSGAGRYFEIQAGAVMEINALPYE
ncbi:hypothetical protein SAMN06298216_4228 [Spirosomataceae bacterium TFI 002]|nr:hypothetical protein SAMN06298216_4228 [Spirosomataceae bacterium TFI 002]